MSKKNRHKKIGNTYYACKNGSNTLRKIIAETDEAAILEADKLFGEDNYTLGTLPKGRTKEEQKQIYRDSEEAAGRLFGPFMKSAMKILHGGI